MAEQRVYVTTEAYGDAMRLFAKDYKAALKVARKLSPFYDGKITIVDKANKITRFEKTGDRLVRLPYLA